MIAVNHFSNMMAIRALTVCYGKCKTDLMLIIVDIKMPLVG